MLSTVVIQNFVHYKEYTRVNLQPGPNFIIGPNASGKSSFFEFIRRCMSMKINHTWSSLNHKDEPACILCEYNLETNQYKYRPNEEAGGGQSDVIDRHTEVPDQARTTHSRLVEETTNDNWIDSQGQETNAMSETPIRTSCSDSVLQDRFQKTLYTGIFYDDANQCFNHICQVVRSDDQSVVESYITSHWYNPKSSNDDYRLCDNYTLFHSKEMFTNSTVHKDIAMCLKYLLTHNPDTFTKEEAIKHSSDILQRINTLSQKIKKTSTTQNENSTVELILSYITDTYFVATFSGRGLSPIHWTRSPSMRRDYMKENYKRSTNSAEILNGLLSDDNVDKSVERRYFNLLTHPWRYNIKRNLENGEAEITVDDGKFTMSVLKIPGGILEAKQLTLMLAHKHFQTLCLEEPDKTMHPQMVERMRDLLWQSSELQGKVILVHSHNQAMMNRWTFDKTYIFRRPQEGTVSVTKPDLKVLRNISRDDVLQLPFASFALITEGAGDKNFIKSMFSHLLQSEKDDTFKVFICNLHVIEMGGVGEYEKTKNLVTQMGMTRETFYILDRDKYVPKITDDAANQIKKEKSHQIGGLVLNFHKDSFGKEDENKLRDLSISKYEEDIDKIQDYCSPQTFQSFEAMDPTLQENNVFIWRSGNLEEMLRSAILERREDFLHACREHVQINQLAGGNRYISYLSRACFLQKIKESYKKESCLNGQDIDFLSKFVLGGSEGKRFLDFLELKWKPPSRV